MAEMPELLAPAEAELGVLVWRFAKPVTALSSAAVGGGISQPQWALNIRVPMLYDRTDLAEHAAEVAEAVGLTGAGVGLFTAAKIDRWQRASHTGVHVDVTSGVSKPTWAADEAGSWTPWQPGTINIVAHMPTPLAPGAAVNAVITVTEAKTQALGELGIPGTGTASDAVTIVWPSAGEPAAFAGPRSEVGSALALATHAAVLATAGRKR